VRIELVTTSRLRKYQIVSFLHMMFPSVQLNTTNTYNVITLFAAVRILIALYSD